MTVTVKRICFAYYCRDSHSVVALAFVECVDLATRNCLLQCGSTKVYCTYYIQLEKDIDDK